MTMTWQQGKDSILVGLLTIGIGLFAWAGSSVVELNKNVAVVINTVGFHDRDIVDLKADIKELKKGH